MINKKDLIFSIKITSIFTVVGVLIALLLSSILSISNLFVEEGFIVLIMLLFIIPILFLLTGIIVSQIHVCSDKNN